MWWEFWGFLFLVIISSWQTEPPSPSSLQCQTQHVEQGSASVHGFRDCNPTWSSAGPFPKQKGKVPGTGTTLKCTWRLPCLMNLLPKQYHSGPAHDSIQPLSPKKRRKRKHALVLCLCRQFPLCERMNVSFGNCSSMWQKFLRQLTNSFFGSNPAGWKCIPQSHPLFMIIYSVHRVTREVVCLNFDTQKHTCLLWMLSNTDTMSENMLMFWGFSANMCQRQMLLFFLYNFIDFETCQFEQCQNNVVTPDLLSPFILVHFIERTHATLFTHGTHQQMHLFWSSVLSSNRNQAVGQETHFPYISIRKKLLCFECGTSTSQFWLFFYVWWHKITNYLSDLQINIHHKTCLSANKRNAQQTNKTAFNIWDVNKSRIISSQDI